MMVGTEIVPVNGTAKVDVTSLSEPYRMTNTGLRDLGVPDVYANRYYVRGIQDEHIERGMAMLRHGVQLAELQFVAQGCRDVCWPMLNIVSQGDFLSFDQIRMAREAFPHLGVANRFWQDRGFPAHALKMQRLDPYNAVMAKLAEVPVIEELLDRMGPSIRNGNSPDAYASDRLQLRTELGFCTTLGVELPHSLCDGINRAVSLKPRVYSPESLVGWN